MKRVFIFFAIIVLLVSCHKENNSTATTDTVLKFTMGSNTYQFSSKDVTAKETVVNGADWITIDANKVIDNAGTVARVHILIIGNTQVNPGIYTAPTWLSLQDGDAVVTDKDFSLQVISYQNEYLDGTFSSSRFSNGIISNLKVSR